MSEWQKFYNSVKGDDYPDCDNEEDFELLPDWIKQELVDMGYNEGGYQVSRVSFAGQRGINVLYEPLLIGGGLTYGQDFLDIIKERYPTKVFNKAYEWCSGVGVLGFSLLDHNICKSLVLSDLHYRSIDYATRTANLKTNRCKDDVTVYLLKDLKLLPTHEIFDLIVAIPPWVSRFMPGTNSRIYTDLNWSAHRHFFENIKSHLSPNGVIILQESMAGSSVRTFKPWIENNGLKINDWFKSKKYGSLEEQVYYIEIMHKEE